MDLETLIAQWSGKLPDGFVPPAKLQNGLAECAHKRCRNKVAIKSDGTPAHACLCVAPHKQAYVVRVVMWSYDGRYLICNGAGR